MKKNKKNRAVGVLLAVFLPGVGQLYAGMGGKKALKAFVLVFGVLILNWLGLIALSLVYPPQEGLPDLFYRFGWLPFYVVWGMQIREVYLWLS